ncbi:MAG: glycosyltransferase family 9 protein, partial [Halothiobacillaceae bacterium]
MQSILIIRLSAIGDVVFASPIIEALRRTHPDAHIAWLAEPAVADL